MDWKNYAKDLEEIISRIEVPDQTRVLINALCSMVRDKHDVPCTRYIRVEWPEYQHFMDSSRWEECIQTSDNAYMIPEDVYDEVVKALEDNTK